MFSAIFRHWQNNTFDVLSMSYKQTRRAYFNIFSQYSAKYFSHL